MRIPPWTSDELLFAIALFVACFAVLSLSEKGSAPRPADSGQYPALYNQ